MFKLPRRSRLRVAVITAVALLIAQFGALAHAYAHDAVIDTGSLAHRGTLDGPGTVDSFGIHATPGTHDFCSDCLNFAPLLAATGAPAAPPFVVPHARNLGPRCECGSLVEHRPHLAFRSRAPPLWH